MSRFRNYVQEIPDGKESWETETGGIHNGELTFVTESQLDTARFPWCFKGAVRFEGYHGAIRIDISDPEISEVEDGILITANTSPPGVAEYRIPMAKAKIRKLATGGFCADSTALTLEGASLFGGVYQPGEPADGFTVIPRETL